MSNSKFSSSSIEESINQHVETSRPSSSVNEARTLRVTFQEKENITKDFLESEYSQYGTVARVDVNQLKGFALVHFFHPLSATRAEQGSKETTRKRHVTIDGKEVINYENIDWIVKHPKNLVSSGSVRAQKSKYVSIPMLHTSDWNLPPRMQEQILRFHQETNSMAGILDKEGMPCADYVSAPVLVIWDIENVNVKANCRGERIKKVILEFLHSQGHVGDNITIHIIAAHEDRLHEDVRKSLEPNGIKFTHLNTYSKQAGDKAIIREIKRWTEENPAPGTVFLISGDKDFSLTVANLEQQKFNTIVAFERGSLSDRMKYVGYKLVEFKTLSQDMGPLESDSKEA